MLWVGANLAASLFGFLVVGLIGIGEGRSDRKRAGWEEQGQKGRRKSQESNVTSESA